MFPGVFGGRSVGGGWQIWGYEPAVAAPDGRPDVVGCGLVRRPTRVRRKSRRQRRHGAVVDVVQAELESMSDAGLVATMTAVGRLIREANGLLARGAAEVARRSPAEAGREASGQTAGVPEPGPPGRLGHRRQRLHRLPPRLGRPGHRDPPVADRATTPTGPPARRPGAGRRVRSVWRRPGRSPACWIGWPAGPTRPTPTPTNTCWPSGPPTSPWNRCSGRSRRSRPGWTRTGFSRGRTNCGRTGPSICGKTVTGCCTCPPTWTRNPPDR